MWIDPAGDASMPIEIELKLRVAAHDLARLRRHALLRNARPVPTRKLHSVYYDTPNLDLWREGISLRLRRGGGRWVQTVKENGRVTAGLHRRTELEAEVVGPAPDVTAIADPELARQIQALHLRAQLEPVMVTRFTRASFLIEPAAGVGIEASIDRGAIESGGTSEPLSELELEIKNGEPWRAYQFALRLLGGIQLLVENRSKAERGIALREGKARQPLKAGPSPVTDGMSAQDAFKTLAHSSLAQFIANQHGMLENGDPEYLHQMRVALRRLLSVFDTFAPLFLGEALAAPIAETRWLAAALAPARDWDVFSTEILPPVVARYPDHAGIGAVTRAAGRLRRSANRLARDAVTSARGQGVLLSIGGWLAAETWLGGMDEAQRAALDGPVIAFAQPVLDSAHARVIKRGRHFARLSPPKLHRLRIAAKRLRYATEFFAPLYDGKKLHDYRVALVQLQDALGRFNDAQTVTELVARASRNLRGTAANEARGIMLGWSASAQDLGTPGLRRIWKNFRTCEPLGR